MLPTLHTIAQWTALRVVESLVEGTVISLFAAVVLHAARRHNASARFAVSFSALMAIVVTPFLGVLRSAGVSRTSHAAITVSEAWALYLFVAGAIVTALFLLRLAKGLWHLQVLRHSCEPVDLQSLDPVLQNTLHRQAACRSFTLCTSDKVRVPAALGLLQPAIVIPTWILRELSPVELNQILLHELAHLRRWDDWTNLAQQFVRAIFFFHPAVWWIEKRLALEREMACDDAVLAETASPRAYAECLTHLAEKNFLRRSVALAQAALGKFRQTSERVAQILNPQRPHAAVQNWKPAASLIAGFAVVCAIGMARAPRLVGFQDESSSHVVVATASSHARHAIWQGASVTATPTAPVVQAKLNTDGPLRRSRVPARPAVVRSSVSKPNAHELIHLTNNQTLSVPIVETMFVVIETRGTRASDDAISGPRIYQIQMWRVLVLPVEPDVNPPQKKT